MKPALPRNLTVGQVRHTVRLLPREEWRRLGEDQRAAIDALAVHIHWRARQQHHPAFDEDDETFLTVGCMRELLPVVGARKTGDRVAAAAILLPTELRADRGHGPGENAAPASRPWRNGQPFQRWSREAALERAAPSLLGSSYWWRVFRIPALTKPATLFLPRPPTPVPPAAL